MKKRENAAISVTTSPRHLPVAELAALVDGPIDSAAANFLCAGSGVLAFHNDTSAMDAVFDMCGKHDATRDVLTALESVGFDETVSASVYNTIVERIADQMALGYLFGVAVGRRLGPQRLAHGSGRGE